MKKALVILAMVLAASWTVSAESPQEKYIAKYSAIAVNEMYRSGVPASITLAQGIIESGSGLSKLALDGNNHFGIKCHNTWSGKKVYADDDRKNECFRAYASAEDSFRDHSDFLCGRTRYAALFELDITHKDICKGYPEIMKYANECRYDDCGHVGEAGCAVDEAFQKCMIDEGRMLRYREFYKL